MSTRPSKEHVVKSCYFIPGMMWPVELGWLFEFFRHSRSHLEIGSYCGKSIYATVQGMESGSAYAVDPLGECLQSLGDYSSPYPGFESKNLTGVIEVLNRTTPVAVAWWQLDSLGAARRARELQISFDSVFIDANHNYAEVLGDIACWLPLVREGGLIAGHDYWPAHPGVMDAVNELFEGRHTVVDGTRIWWVRKDSSLGHPM